MMSSIISVARERSRERDDPRPLGGAVTAVCGRLRRMASTHFPAFGIFFWSTAARPFLGHQSRRTPQTDMCARSVWRLTIRVPEERYHNLHSRHRGAAADPGPLIRRALLDIRAVKSSILERNVLRIGDVFAL